MGVKLPGEEIAKIRSQLGLSANQFAAVLGVHASSVHRWEAAGRTEVAVDGVAANILTQMSERLKSKKTAPPPELGDQIASALLVGGALVALVALLNWLTEEQKRR